MKQIVRYVSGKKVRGIEVSRKPEVVLPGWRQQTGKASALVPDKSQLAIPETEEALSAGAGKSWGILETKGFANMAQGIDAMLKAAHVELLKCESIGGDFVVASIRGDINSVKVAVEKGLAAIATCGDVRGSVLTNPYPPIAPFLGLEALSEVTPRWRRRIKTIETEVSPGAMGLIETKGFVALVAALDAMVKAAEVQISGYGKAEDWLIATVTGELGAVLAATEVGAGVAKELGRLVTVQVIPRPVDGMDNLLPFSLIPLRSYDSPEIHRKKGGKQ